MINAYPSRERKQDWTKRLSHVVSDKQNEKKNASDDLGHVNEEIWFAVSKVADAKQEE